MITKDKSEFINFLEKINARGEPSEELYIKQIQNFYFEAQKFNMKAQFEKKENAIDVLGFYKGEFDIMSLEEEGFSYILQVELRNPDALNFDTISFIQKAMTKANIDNDFVVALTHEYNYQSIEFNCLINRENAYFYFNNDDEVAEQAFFSNQ